MTSATVAEMMYRTSMRRSLMLIYPSNVVLIAARLVAQRTGVAAPFDLAQEVQAQLVGRSTLDIA